MKRILIFSLVYYPRYIGGAEVAVKEITDRLPDIEFDMVTLRKHASAFERIGNVNIYRVGWPWITRGTSSSKIFPLSKYAFPFFALAKALSLHRTRHYDATWSIMANYAGFGALFFKYLHPEVPFVLTLQEGDPLEYIKKRVGLLYPLFARIFRKADIIQAISNFLADWANRMGYRDKVEVIPNGVDTSLFTREYPREDLAALRQSLGIGQEDKVLITTSRLVEKNGVGDVIESLSLLPKEVKFLVLGVGPLDAVLKAQAKELGVEQKVRFLGFVDHSEMPKYLKIADIFIRPSLSEGMGNSFIEAMAAGVPVIATPVGGIPDFLFDPDKDHDMPATGLFVEPQSPRLIAHQVQRLLSNLVLRDKIIINAKRLALEKYDWNLISEEMKSKVFKS